MGFRKRFRGRCGGERLYPAAGYFAGLADTGLLAARGGTESVGLLLRILAVASFIAAGIFLRGVSKKAEVDPYARLASIGAVTFFALAIYVSDFWITGGGTNYGSQKFAFLLVIVATTTALPLALMLSDPAARSEMSALRCMGAAWAVVLLTSDSILPRAVANSCPEKWPPPIPFDNHSSSYWWPAEVNGSSNQPIASNPVACRYLPTGANAPSAMAPSALPDARRVCACTRQLTGLSGADSCAQPNRVLATQGMAYQYPGVRTRVSGAGAQLPDFVLDRPVLVLDEGSNVNGLESLRALLER